MKHLVQFCLAWLLCSARHQESGVGCSSVWYSSIFFSSWSVSRENQEKRKIDAHVFTQRFLIIILLILSFLFIYFNFKNSFVRLATFGKYELNNFDKKTIFILLILINSGATFLYVIKFVKNFYNTKLRKLSVFIK